MGTPYAGGLTGVEPTRMKRLDTLGVMELHVGPHKRLRCAKCGNLTRFDVIATTKSRTYWHFDLAGVPAAEETEVLEQSVELVRCRWCGATDGVEEIPLA